MYPPDYLDEYRGDMLKIVADVFLVLDVFFVVLRFCSCYVQKRRLRLDDWLMIPAFSTVLGTIILAYREFCLSRVVRALISLVVSIDTGVMGRHTEWAIMHPDKLIVWYRITTIAMPVINACAVVFPKFVVTAMYLTVFVDKPSRYATYALNAILCVHMFVNVNLLIYHCSTFAFGWESIIDPNLHDGWCVNYEPRFRYPSIGNIGTDIIIILLPIPLVWKLQASGITKFGLLITFGLGSIGIVTACVRFAMYFKYPVYEDMTWNSVNLAPWCIIEPSLYLIAACLIACRPLAVKLCHASVWPKSLSWLRCLGGGHEENKAKPKLTAEANWYGRSQPSTYRVTAYGMTRSTGDLESGTRPSIELGSRYGEIIVYRDFSVASCSPVEGMYNATRSSR